MLNFILGVFIWAILATHSAIAQDSVPVAEEWQILTQENISNLEAFTVPAPDVTSPSYILSEFDVGANIRRLVRSYTDIGNENLLPDSITVEDMSMGTDSLRFSFTRADLVKFELSSSGNYLAIGLTDNISSLDSSGNTIQLIDTQSGELMLIIDGNPYNFQFSSDGTELYVLQNHTINVIDTTSLTIREINLDQNLENAEVTVCPQTKCLAIRTFALPNVITYVSWNESDIHIREYEYREAGSGFVFASLFDSASEYFLLYENVYGQSRSRDVTLFIVDLATGQTATHHSMRLRSTLFANIASLYLEQLDETITVYEIATNRIVGEFAYSPDMMLECFHPSGEMMVFSNPDDSHTLYIHSVETKAELAQIQLPSDFLQASDVVCEERFIATADQAGQIVFWRINIK
jgi:WD40 repeat protein